ncbi:MAG: hypothetical protein NVS4B10_22290 [Myxococcales bacterium]
MFFAFAQLARFAAAPLTWALLLLCAAAALGLARRPGSPRLASLAALLALGLLAAFSSSRVSNALLRSLERDALDGARLELDQSALVQLL